jgi:hypothetical protein
MNNLLGSQCPLAGKTILGNNNIATASNGGQYEQSSRNAQ